jgi:kynureninase
MTQESEANTHDFRFLENPKLYEQAKRLDKVDPLAALKDEFLLPDKMVYLDGNSLGPLPKKAKKRAIEVVEKQWGESLIASWNTHDWIGLPLKVGNKIAPLIGAPQNTVICCDSISVNLFKLLSAALHLQSSLSKASHQKAERRFVLSQRDNFPTDLYMVQGLQTMLEENTSKQCELLSVDASSIMTTLEQQGDDIAVLMLTHVNFKTGEVHDMQEITELAHKKGVLVLWDLAHSAGVMPLELESWQVDFAVGCTYKYLNGGPGAPGFAYVAKRHLPTLQQPLSGWMGHKKPFAFTHDYQKADGIEQLLAGTPSIISMSVLDAALDMFDNISVSAIRDKSIALNDFFLVCMSSLFSQYQIPALTLACDKNSEQRGSQVSYSHEHAYAICQALIANGVVADFRAPNILRIGFSPLFLSYVDILKAAQILSNVIQKSTYLEAQYQTLNKVT